MPRNAIGIVELSSIATGFAVADAMLKAGDVELLVARTICSGKYLTMVRGEVADVETSVNAGIATGGTAVIDTCVLPNIHEAVFPAISGSGRVEDLEALGIIEAFSVTSLLEAADAAVKAADVDLIEIRLAMALGGKAFVTLTGDVASVEAAVQAGAEAVAEKGLLVNHVVIPRPRQELLNEMV